MQLHGVDRRMCAANGGKTDRQNLTLYGSTAKHTPSARLPAYSALAPGGRHDSYSCDIGAPRPTRSRMTMTGSRFPGSRVIASDHLPRELSNPQWYLWPSAIRLQLRG